MPQPRPCPICKRQPRLVECVDRGGWNAICDWSWTHIIAVYGATRTLAVIAWDEAWPNGIGYAR